MSWTLDQSEPVARKEHRCIWCGQTILKGEKYDRWVGIFEGDFNCNKFHKECSKASGELDPDDGFCAYGEERPIKSGDGQ